MRSRKWTPERKNMLYLRWNLNAKIMHGVVLKLNGKISLYFFTENIYSELCINILKEKLPEIKRVAHKNLILVRDNTPVYKWSNVTFY